MRLPTLFVACLAIAAPTPLLAQAAPPRVPVDEATIAGIHAAFASGALTCRGLMQRYLDRIEAIDKQGPAINAIVMVNPRALATADSLDAVRARRAPLGPLHCVPVIVKDNFETHDLQTTAGSLSLKGWVPRRDATQVARVRAAGGVVLAKANLAEWAFTPYETVSSILPGYTKNPYALDRVTAGSSGGTAAAVAANEGAVGLGSDTGNSIRGPSAHTALVGIRSTMGLTSRAGVIPLNAAADIAGPMTRTVTDAVELLQVIAGADPEDPVTAASEGRREADYRTFLVPGGLRGARIGVLVQAYQRPTTDPEVVAVFARALEAMRAAGATIVDPARIADLDSILASARGGCNRFRHDLETYFAARGEGAPVRTVDEILRSGAYHPSTQVRLQAARAVSEPPDSLPGCASREAMRERLRTATVALMDSLRLDALVYPTWSNVPRLIGDLNTPHGDNSQVFSPLTGFPAINVPMGFTRGGTLPAGITFFGRPWSEGRLITLSYAFEQATRSRRPPALGPS
ncbi:MAG: amidase [Gemmatimonadales bacterium]|nr:amidase [Gemmatimonadales bacterium]